MMYLIKKNDKYLVMDSDIETIRKYCGLDARIMFAWEEDEQSENIKDLDETPKKDIDIVKIMPNVLINNFNKELNGFLKNE